MDEPLDFEKEEEYPLLAPPRPAKRKKVIGLDDLLLDYFETGKEELRSQAAGNSKHGPKAYNSDDLDDLFTANSEREIEICRIVESVEEEAKKMDAREDVPLWGQKIFGCQIIFPAFCVGEGFLEGLLMDGWLLKLVHISGSVEDSVASWMLTKR